MQTIGSTAFITLADRYQKVPAKIDTGADSTSVWASDIKMSDQGELSFVLFDKTSPFYDGHRFTFQPGQYSIISGRTSTGIQHLRYCVHLSIKLGKKKIRATVTLANRSRNSMPVLIGRKTLSHKFLVDVSENPTGRNLRFAGQSQRLTQEMRENPSEFHQKFNLGN